LSVPVTADALRETRGLDFFGHKTGRHTAKGHRCEDDSGLFGHARVTTTLDVYSQSIDASRLNAQKVTALAFTGNGPQSGPFTGEESQVKF
jgi:hypothetical protein